VGLTDALRGREPQPGRGSIAEVPTLGEQQSMEVPPPRDLGLLAVAIVGVSASGPLMAAAAAPALAIAFWRNALGAGLTGLASLRTWREFATIERRTFGLAALGGAFLALHFGTWVPSVKYTSVASATALVATQAIFSAIIAAGRGHRLPRVAWIGMVLAIVGTAFVAGADFGVSTRALVGDGLAVAGGLFAAAYVSVGSVARRTMSVVTYTTVCYGVCSAGLLMVCLVGGQPLGGYSPRAWVLIAGVTICAQIFGHTLINVVLRSASATFVGLAILLETPGAAIIAAIWLHQTPSAWAIPGLVLLLGGLVMTIRAKSAVELVPADVD
jgi:drug/metabolite transporter (DMT)-like permease